MFTTPTVERPWGVHFFRGKHGDAGFASVALPTEPDEEVVMAELNKHFRFPARGFKGATMAEITKDGEVIARYCAYDRHSVVKSPVTYTPGWKRVERSFD